MLSTYSIYLSTSDLLSFIISNADKHEVSSIWKWISCCNDYVIKRVVYSKKMRSYSKNIHDIIIFFFLKISVVYQEKIYHRCYCMDIPFVER